MKNRRSKVWKISKQDLELIVKKSNSLSEILSNFHLNNKGSNYKTLKKRLSEDNIDFSHIKMGLSSNKGRKLSTQSGQPLEEILVENSTYTNRWRLKIRLLRANLIDNICYKCGLEPKWNGEPLSLQIDHINGKSNDNRLCNLRMLCPNCHSQTPNFAGRNKHYAN